MKIYIPSLNKPPTTGKGFFYRRLSKALQSLGCDIVTDENSRVDVALHNVRVRKNNAPINIIRIDGVYHDIKKNYKKLNKSIFKGYHVDPDGIIFQSKFSNRMADRYLGKFEGPSTIIPNGVSFDECESSTPKEKEYKYNFFSYSRWRPHKRLADIIHSFLIASLEDSCLYIAGDISQSDIPTKARKKMFSLPNIKYVGKLNQQEISSYLKIMDGVIHLCWFDSCPNSVVEAIGHKVPVICNNVGGTPEIVGLSNGYICNIDKKYDLKPVDLYHPPAIDRNIIAYNINRAARENRIIEREHINIINIAKKYLEFFKEVS